MTPKTLTVRFRWTAEDLPDHRWRALFHRAWSSYRTWFLREGDEARPTLDAGRARLVEYMPELLPVWERLVDLSDGDEQAARMLTLYRPTPYVAGCTQAVVAGPEPALVRNYDYHPHGFEAAFVRTRWLGTTVVAASDCLWGALDGINEHGLAVALSFGGSRAVGDGFGIPLILRYVLESCATVDEAVAVLRRVPSHMAYNVSLLDAAGRFAVAHLRPGRETEVVREPVSTNHQGRIEWSEYATSTRSVERKAAAQAAVDEGDGVDAVVERFLSPPLFMTDYARWHGTLYTAAYHPSRRGADAHWPGGSVRQTLDGFSERSLDVPFRMESVERAEAGGRA